MDLIHQPHSQLAAGKDDWAQTVDLFAHVSRGRFPVQNQVTQYCFPYSTFSGVLRHTIQ